jgi:DnaJ-like protein
VPNYYEILEVSPSATLNDIKKSFRHLALKHHPDKNRNSEESKQKFMKIVEAYEVLSDDLARRNYDTSVFQRQKARPPPAWTPSADFHTVYSYEEIKKRYSPSTITGGMWDISDKASFGMWKATLVLFACLAAIVIYIMLVG